MMKKTKIAILLSIILIGGLVLGSLWVKIHEKRASENKDGLPNISTEGADMRLEKIRLVEESHGRRTWELEAKQIQQYQDQNLMILEDVKVTYYSKDGRLFIVSGREGRFHQDSKNMELVGDVMLTSSDGYRLRTQSVSYDHSRKQVTTPDPVEIEGEQIRLLGKGMMVDMEGKIFKVLNEVKTQWRGGRRG
jgi:LPS export ABC transporter protein LptC